MKGGVTWGKNSLLIDCSVAQAREHVPFPLAAIHTDDLCCESLQQWDKHPVEEKQTELEREKEMLQLLLNSCFHTTAMTSSGVWPLPFSTLKNTQSGNEN